MPRLRREILASKLEWDNSAILPQIKCPIFSRLPAEIRTRVFEYTLSAYDDPTDLDRNHGCYHGPRYECRQIISTALLRTCRRIYSEARLIPALVNELVGSPTLFMTQSSKFKGTNDLMKESLMTKEQFRLIRVQLYTHQFWLESVRFVDVLKSWKASPRSLCITLRHTDWWASLQRTSTLALDPKQYGQPEVGVFKTETEPFAKGSWGSALRHIPDLQEFEMELETTVAKKEQLARIVSYAPTWRFPLSDRTYLKLDERRTRSISRVGPVAFFDTSRRYRDKTGSTDMQELSLVSLTWTIQDLPAESH